MSFNKGILCTKEGWIWSDSKCILYIIGERTNITLFMEMRNTVAVSSFEVRIYKLFFNSSSLRPLHNEPLWLYYIAQIYMVGSTLQIKFASKRRCRIMKKRYQADKCAFKHRCTFMNTLGIVHNNSVKSQSREPKKNNKYLSSFSVGHSLKSKNKE